MAAKLAFQYDREADILHISSRPPYAEQESEELGDDVIARLEFDHVRTDYPLEGAHRAVPCLGCHEAGARHREAPARCADCHADAARMKPHDLDPTIPARWEASAHVRLAASGAASGAGCVSCHGVHDVLSRRDPASRTHHDKVSSLCASCHADAARMGGSKLPTDQYAEYMAGAHGRVMAHGDAQARALAPSCADCHGAHGSTPPNALDVPSVCKDCHFEAYRFILPGYNARPLELSGAIGIEQLKKLDAMVETRRRNAALFLDLMKGDARFIVQRENGRSSWFAFTIILNPEAGAERARVMGALKEKFAGRMDFARASGIVKEMLR